ncbi:hypothetical protein HPP92_005560 [Vanilla planifolia]|uniref:Pentatricopeptide repeat-containing protein n=1 Tax=Vanilla planifolia TaxID=51239 RepID=A0A835RTT9_VANPL|nr:hypothetical protein HPP92_005560 [Vanilla planifolia]
MAVFFLRCICSRSPRRYLSVVPLDAGGEHEVIVSGSIISDSVVSGDAKHSYLTVRSLLKSETDPSRILDLCHSASLSPDHHLGRSALSAAVSSLAASPNHLPAVRSLVAPLVMSKRHVPHAISLFGLAGLLDDAAEAFRSSPSLFSLNALLFACILSNNHKQAGTFFRDIPVSYAIKPNIVTYNTVIKAFCESGGSRTFYSFLDEMVRKDVKPNLTTFSIALSGFYREELFSDVKKVLWLMKKNGRHAGLSIYNARIQSLCKLGRPEEAKELLREMRPRGMKPSWVTYDHLILGYCSVGNLEEAKRLFKEMGRKQLVPQSSCYFSLIYYLCRNGDFGSALEICRESMDQNWVPQFSTMKMLVDGLVGTLQVKEARELVEKVKGKFFRNMELWNKIEEALPK